nr:hypothetical protein [uncultured Rothia sp.]
MGLKDWIAPFITLLIGASTIFISYKNYQAQAAAKPSELARLELWSKLLTEAGMDISALPDPESLTSDQRVVLETTGSSSNVPPSNRSCVKLVSTATASSACS